MCKMGHDKLKNLDIYKEFFRLMQLLKGSWCFHSDMPMTFGTYLNGKFKMLKHLKYNFLKIH